MSRWAVHVIEFLFRWWMGRAKRQAFFEVRKKGIQAYLKFLQGARLTAVGFITALIVLQLIGFGLAMMVTAGVLLSPWEMEIKLWIVFGVGASLFLIPVLGLSFLLSQRLWYRASGAEDMVNDLLKSKSS